MRTDDKLSGVAACWAAANTVDTELDKLSRHLCHSASLARRYYSRYLCKPLQSLCCASVCHCTFYGKHIVCSFGLARYIVILCSVSDSNRGRANFCCSFKKNICVNSARLCCIYNGQSIKMYIALRSRVKRENQRDWNRLIFNFSSSLKFQALLLRKTRGIQNKDM